LDAAINYIKMREDLPIIVSGGQGRDEPVSEAESMLRYLAARGIDESRIWKEDSSASTRENLLFSKELMIKKGMIIESTNVLIVSSEFHLFRINFTAKKVGLNVTCLAAKTPGILRKTFYRIREVLALIKETVIH